ncbi:MAG TPA: LacI family transcriptional regulator [Janthinobacterium sp.]|nr:LacI family transcriptional regulator [Janthinobacterium sp.]
MTNKAATLSDIARATGVHLSTVSRVMNPDTRHMVGAEAGKRILAEARRLGYRANRAASTLATRKSNIIGVVLPDITNPVFPPILTGIEEGLRKHGYQAIVANVGADEEEQRFVINLLLGQQVDGLILATARRHDAVVKMCVDQRVPLVTVNRREESGIASCVISDDGHGMALAVGHLLALGHRHIAHIAGLDALSTGHLRRLGFAAAMAQAGAPAFVFEAGGHTRACGKAALLELLRRAPHTTAVVTGNDLVAIGCYDALAELGLRCPQDVSIVGHNDVPFMDIVRPPLTTVRLRHHGMGAEAARLILQMIETPGAPVLDIRLKPELVARESSAPPRA